jgi:hypothetical protein
MKGEENMHLDHVIEVQDQTPFREAEALSPEELLQFFPRWMGEHDVSTRLALFVAWMRSENDDKFKKTLFVSWMNLESGNRKLLKATAVLVTDGFTKHDRSEIEHWIEVAVEKDDGRSTDEIAHA